MAPKELRKSRTLRVNTASLVQFRKERGLTTTAFAREVGIQQGSMSHIENGTREPSPPVAKRMAEVLKVPLGAILAEVAVVTPLLLSVAGALALALRAWWVNERRA